jgi:thiamine-phosphate diphosphorylase/hydroxyethylthiazole kinase
VLYQSQSRRKGLDGVAIVSSIMAADDPETAAADLARRINSPPRFATIPKAARVNETAALLDEVPQIVEQVVKAHPLAHSMINYVVANFVANAVLAMCVPVSWSSRHS